MNKVHKLPVYVGRKQLRVLYDGRFGIGVAGDMQFIWQHNKSDRRKIRKALVEAESPYVVVAMLNLKQLPKEDLEIMGYPNQHAANHHATHYLMEQAETMESTSHLWNTKTMT